MPVQPFCRSTVTVIGKLPDCVGVPDRTPVAGKREAGRQRAAVERERRRADARRCVKVWLKAASTVPVLWPGW